MAWMSVRKDVIELPDGKTVHDYYMWEHKDEGADCCGNMCK